MWSFYLIFKREILIAYRQRSEIINPWIFFLIIISLFPLALNPDPHLLMIIAPGIIWVGILLMTLLSLERLFKRDVDDGIIEQWLLVPNSFAWLIFAKLLSHWIVCYLPLFIFMPILGEWLHLSTHAVIILIITLLLATPSLSFIGAIFCALTVRLRQSGLLLALLVLPFYIPILIFAASAVADASIGLPVIGQLAFLGAITALVLPLGPLVTTAALKIGMS